MLFSARIKSAREALELTGEFVGEQVGVSKATISHWENGRYQPNIEQIRGLCRVLKVSPNWLFEVETIDLPPDALEEAKTYAALSQADKRKWKAMRQMLFSTANT